MDSDAFPMDTARILLDTEDLEWAARDAVVRLLSDGWKDPRPECGKHEVAGRPGWWWRFRLLEWAGSARALRRCDREALRAFRLFLAQLNEGDACLFVKSLLPDPGEAARSA